MLNFIKGIIMASGIYWTREMIQEAVDGPDGQSLNPFKTNLTAERMQVRTMARYLAQKIQSGELEITVANQLQCLAVSQLADTGLVCATIPGIRRQLVCEYSFKWARDRFIELQAKDAANAGAPLAGQNANKIAAVVLVVFVLLYLRS